MPVELAGLAEHVGGRDGEVERQLRGQRPLARPRTPSVPKSRPTSILCPRSALAVLGSLAGLLQAGLLALLDPRVAGEQAGLLERGAVGLVVDGVQAAGDAEAQRAGLAGDAAAVDAGDDVERAARPQRRRTAR